MYIIKKTDFQRLQNWVLVSTIRPLAHVLEYDAEWAGVNMGSTLMICDRVVLYAKVRKVHVMSPNIFPLITRTSERLLMLHTSPTVTGSYWASWALASCTIGGWEFVTLLFRPPLSGCQKRKGRGKATYSCSKYYLLLAEVD